MPFETRKIVARNQVVRICVKMSQKIYLLVRVIVLSEV
jgi:hypothetical protein